MESAPASAPPFLPRPDSHVFWKSHRKKDKREKRCSSALLPCTLHYCSAFCHDSHLSFKEQICLAGKISAWKSTAWGLTVIVHLLPSLISAYLPGLLSHACLFCVVQLLVTSKPQISKSEYDGGEITSSRISFSKEPKFLVSPFRWQMKFLLEDVLPQIRWVFFEVSSLDSLPNGIKFQDRLH